MLLSIKQVNRPDHPECGGEEIMLYQEAAAVLKRWNYPFETLEAWSLRDDPWCEDEAVEAYLADALFLVYKIAEVGMGKYYGFAAVLFDHEHPTLCLDSESPIVLGRQNKPEVTPDGRYAFACFYSGVLLIDLMKKKYTGFKLDHYSDLVRYTMQPSRNTFSIYHKEKGGVSTILPDLLNWHEGPGKAINVTECFESYDQALEKPKWYFGR